MRLTCISMIIFLVEVYQIHLLEKKYRGPREEKLEVEEILCRFSLEDLLRWRHHIITSWLAMGFASIGSVLKGF